MRRTTTSTLFPYTTLFRSALIGMGTTRHIDVGRVIASGPSASDVFVECAGVGLSSMLAAAGQSVEKDRKSTRLNSSHVEISYAVFCLKKKRDSITPSLSNR